MNHDQLLEFIHNHGTIAGQLCLNLAGLLADRLQKENSVVSKVKMDLDVAISSLRTASEEDNLKSIALKELQSKVDSLNPRRVSEKKTLANDLISTGFLYPVWLWLVLQLLAWQGFTIPMIMMHPIG